jgi:hypothetical protein
MPSLMIDALTKCAKDKGKARSQVLREAVAEHLKAKGYLK